MKSDILRIGLLLGGFEVPAWIGQLLERIQSLEGVELCVVAVSARPKAFEPVPSIDDFGELFRQVDQTRLEKYMRTRRVRALTSVATLGLPLESAVYAGEGAPDETIEEAVHRLNPDLLLNLGFGPVPPIAISDTPLGMWFYDHLAPEGGPTLPGLDTIVAGTSESLVRLVVESVPHDPRVFATLPLRTHPTSPSINALRLHLAGISLLLYALTRIRAGQLTPAGLRREFSEHFSQPRPRIPVFRRMLFLCRSASRVLSERLRKSQRVEQWSFGLVDTPPERLCPADMSEVRWYMPDESRFVADPFPIRIDGRLYVFVEDYSYERARGHIGVIEVMGDGTFSLPRPVIERDFHLSFPFVFQEGGALYLVPEQSSTCSVCLYECVSFPERWELRRVLLSHFAGIDNVLFRRDGLWWLFTCFGEFGNQDNNLHLFYSPSLTGTFVPHPQNPVKIGLRGSRMAGRIIEHEGKLYRPSQNCVERYGKSIVVQEITTLTTTEFAEREVQELSADPASPFPLGCNTLAAWEGITAVACLRMIERRTPRELLPVQNDLASGSILTPAGDRTV